MAKERDTRPTTPSRFAETTPPQPYPSGDFSYTLEVVMEMQKTLGAHTQALSTLTEEFKGIKSKVDHLSHVIYAAGAVGTVLLAIGIWIFNRIADVVISHLAATPPVK